MAIVWLLVQKIADGCPHEVVLWRHVNDAVGAKNADSHTASQPVRSKLGEINDQITASFGTPPPADPDADEDWLETVKTVGVRLKTSVTWCITEDLWRLLCGASVHDHPTNPHILADTVSHFGQKVPKRSLRSKPKRTDDDSY